MLRELFYTVTFVKAGNAQLQVLKGEKNQGCSFNAEQELMLFKGSEIAAESIPGTVLQLFALLTTKERGSLQIASFGLSVLVTGHASSALTYYIDTSVNSRNKSGEK